MGILEAFRGQHNRIEIVYVAVAAYVTTQARLKLKENPTNWRSLSCTYSVIFIQNLVEPPKVRTGDYYGSPHRQIGGVCVCSFIHEFVSGGQNNYAFSVFCPSTGKRTTKYKVKCKTFNYETSKVINFTTLRYMILKDTASVHVHNLKWINGKYGGVVSEPERKEYNVIFKERRLMDNFNSLTLGID